jgi:cyclopropane fatty-acyl-phospholipid synthase-like methyltransferase
MFEAVGEKYWPAYFSKLEQCLKPGGKAGLQIITIRRNRSSNTAAIRTSSRSTFFPAACYQPASI